MGRRKERTVQIQVRKGNFMMYCKLLRCIVLCKINIQM